MTIAGTDNMGYLTILIIALCSLGQRAFGSPIKLSDLADLAPAPLGTDHPPLVLNAALRPSSELNNIAGSEISLPIGQTAHALMTLMTQTWLNLGSQPAPLSKTGSSASYADDIFPLNITLTPNAQSPNILTSQTAGWAAIDQLSSLLSLANPNDTTVRVPTSQIIFNKILSGGTIALQRGGGPTGDQSLWAAHLVSIDDAGSSTANYSSGYDGYNIALSSLEPQIPAKTVIGLVFQLLTDLPLSQTSNASWTDQNALKTPGTVVQSDALDGYVIQITFVPGAEGLGVGWANLAIGLRWMIVKSAIKGRWWPMSAEFSTLPSVDAVERETWAKVEVLKAPTMGKRDGVRRLGGGRHRVFGLEKDEL